MDPQTLTCLHVTDKQGQVCAPIISPLPGLHPMPWEPTSLLGNRGGVGKLNLHTSLGLETPLLLLLSRPGVVPPTQIHSCCSLFAYKNGYLSSHQGSVAMTQSPNNVSLKHTSVFRDIFKMQINCHLQPATWKRNLASICVKMLTECDAIFNLTSTQVSKFESSSGGSDSTPCNCATRQPTQLASVSLSH